MLPASQVVNTVPNVKKRKREQSAATESNALRGVNTITTFPGVPNKIQKHKRLQVSHRIRDVGLLDQYYTTPSMSQSFRAASGL
jgi:hypothetical protein